MKIHRGSVQGTKMECGLVSKNQQIIYGSGQGLKLGKLNKYGVLCSCDAITVQLSKGCPL